MFEQASRLKLRFETTMGLLSVEDLWELPLASKRGPNLNDIAIGLYNQTKHDTVSFVEDEQKPSPALQLRFDIVKHIIDVRKLERRAAEDAKDRAEKKQKIMAVMSRKQDGALENMSMEELQGLLATL